MNGRQSLGSNQHIVFFDGVCNLCNKSVQYIIKKDKHKLFRFTSLQSDFTAHFFTQHQYAPPTDSIIYWDTRQFHIQSAAVLKIACLLGFPTSLLAAGYILPKPLRDAMYRLIARNRYKWFGKRDSCIVPSAELQSRFL